MNDERLSSLLGSLRQERMDRVADDKVRARLETAWTARSERRSFTFRARRWAPVLATLVLVAGLGLATMNASGDSALYGVRVAIEDAAVVLHPSPEDRNEYLLALLDQRQAEAARLESSGNALAASKVRQIEQDTLRRLQASLPQLPDQVPAVVASPSPTPTPNTPTPTVAPTPSPSPLPTTTGNTTVTPRTPTPPPTRTPSPTPSRTPTPTFTPTGSPMVVTVVGTIKNPDGSLASGVCVMQSTVSGCLIDPATQTGGTYRITISARLNQTIVLYFTRTDAGVQLKATATKVVTGTTVTMPSATLQKF